MTPRTAGILLDDYDVITRIRKSDTSACYLLIDRLYSNVTLGPFSHSMKGDMAELERGLASLGFKRLSFIQSCSLAQDIGLWASFSYCGSLGYLYNFIKVSLTNKNDYICRKSVLF